MYFTDSWTVLQRVLKLGANMLLFGICTFFGQPSVSCVQAWIVDFPSVRWPFKNREQPMMNQRGWGILGVSNCCCCFLELSKAFFICLVVHLPLWKIWKSVGMIISQYMEKWKMFQTTNQYIYILWTTYQNAWGSAARSKCPFNTQHPEHPRSTSHSEILYLWSTLSTDTSAGRGVASPRPDMGMGHFALVP